MGNGGIPLEMGSAGVKRYKLEYMATEELRKWAKRYGEEDSEPREELLKKLVGAFAC